MIKQAYNDLIESYPKFTDGKIKVLKERFQFHKFTDQEIIDSIYRVIDNYKGFDQNPPISEFLIKENNLLTFDEKNKYISEMNKPENELVEVVKLENKVMWRKL